MASKAKWVLGCGLGCAGLAIVAIVLVVIGTSSLVRETTGGFEAATQQRQALEERAEAQPPYVPAPDGRIAAERIEVFLAVREATRPTREGIQGFFEHLPTTREEAEELDSKPTMEKLGTVFGITRSAFGFGKDLGELLHSRNRTLLEVGMGLDEYSYLYTVVYGAWLGHGLEAGPEIAGENAGFVIDNVLDRVGDDLRRMLTDQLAAAEAAEVSDAWRTELAAEVARLKADRRTLPWEEGVPEPVAASLEPFRERLSAEFSPESNPFELGSARKRGRFSFDLE